MPNREHDVELALTSMADRLDLPAEPDIATRVTAHLASHPTPRTRGGFTAAPNWRPVLSAVASIVVLAIAITVFSPATRDAVADWVGLGGVRITHVPEPKERVGTDLALGDPITLEDAEARVSFPVRAPTLLGPPDEIYAEGEDEHARLSFVYRAGDDLPPADGLEVGALFEQFQATIERDILSKQIFGGANVRAVQVDGADGYWLSGGAHQVTYLDPNGIPTQDHQRLAGNTLLWEIDGVVFRLEAEIPLARALTIARSLS